ncbi:hypothetical protein [Paraburkholderia sacchari]|uniref:hypothetical protein n=1 Tax=Paraburkholderia sacchari TaxID=159450 RepID=UPI003D95A34D
MAANAIGARTRTPAVPQTLPAFIADALRRATLAPTDREALDIAGGALAVLAQLARAEVRHG